MQGLIVGLLWILGGLTVLFIGLLVWLVSKDNSGKIGAPPSAPVQQPAPVVPPAGTPACPPIPRGAAAVPVKKKWTFGGIVWRIFLIWLALSLLFGIVQWSRWIVKPGSFEADNKPTTTPRVVQLIPWNHPSATHSWVTLGPGEKSEVLNIPVGYGTVEKLVAFTDAQYTVQTNHGMKDAKISDGDIPWGDNTSYLQYTSRNGVGTITIEVDVTPLK